MTVAPSPPRTGSGWHAAAGPALLVQGATLDQAIALFPFEGDSDAMARLDSASLQEASVVLFGRGGRRFSAQLGPPSDEGMDECERWPLRDVRDEGGTGVSWSVGFLSHQVEPLVLDSVDVLSPRDSLALAAEASRLASNVSASTDAAFRGLRFTALDIRRFEATPGVQALVAHLVRRVNQEANPQEEQTLVIAERDSGATSGRYQLAYAERAFGREEAVVTPEVLAAVRIHDSEQPILVVARDGDRGVSYSLLERTGVRRWRAGWSSGVVGCAN